MSMGMVTTRQGEISFSIYTGQAGDQFTIDWGDLSTPDVWTTVDDDDVYPCYPSHEYSGAGSKTISITGDLVEVIRLFCAEGNLTWEK